MDADDIRNLSYPKYEEGATGFTYNERREFFNLACEGVAQLADISNRLMALVRCTESIDNIRRVFLVRTEHGED